MVMNGQEPVLTLMVGRVRPARIHPDEHGSPVRGLRTARPRTNVDVCPKLVDGIREPLRRALSQGTLMQVA